MDSFYGGHQGTPFIIKTKFGSIADMIAAFSAGAEYKDVWYGEYCIIDTPNKNDPDNGKIFRRGAEYTQNGDPIYIGQIVGPSGSVPILEISPLDQMVKVEERQEGGQTVIYNLPNPDYLDEFVNLLTYPNISRGLSYDADPYNITSNDDQIAINELTIQDMVKGSESNGVIKWTWYNEERDKSEIENWQHGSSITKVGFKFPYNEFVFKPDLRTMYDADGKILENYLQDIIPDEVEEGNPFYWNVQLPIFQGISGISYSDFCIVDFSDPIEDLGLYTPDQLESGTDNDGRPFLRIKSDDIGEPGFEPEASNENYGYVVRVSAFNTCINPKAKYLLNKINGKITMVANTIEPGHEDEYDYDQTTGMIRSIWIYLGVYVNSKTMGTVLYPKTVNEQAEESTYNDIFNSFAGGYGSLITYDENVVIDKNNWVTKEWWASDYDNNGSIVEAETVEVGG